MEYAYILYLMRFRKWTYDQQATNALVTVRPLNTEIPKEADLQHENCCQLSLRRQTNQKELQSTLKQKVEKMDSCALIIVPIIFVLVSIIYYAYYHEYG